MDTRRKLLLGIGVAALGAAMTLSVRPLAAAAEAGRTGSYQECRGVTVDKTAPVISRAGVLIKAPLAKVWRLHTDIDQWQNWIPEITPAHKETPGPLRPGSVFTWSPQNMKAESTITPLRCTAWGAPVNGITGVHLWTFRQTGAGVLATTEESWAGPPVEADVPGNQRNLDQGLADWAHRLKDTAEASSGCH